MNQIQLTFTVDEVNQILEALGQQPYIAVSQLIGKIQQQASSQLQDAENVQPNVLPPQEQE